MGMTFGYHFLGFVVHISVEFTKHSFIIAACCWLLQDPNKTLMRLTCVFGDWLIFQPRDSSEREGKTTLAYVDPGSSWNEHGNWKV